MLACHNVAKYSCIVYATIISSLTNILNLSCIYSCVSSKLGHWPTSFSYFREDTYVRVIGHMKAFNEGQMRSVIAFSVVPIQDFNEISFHLLDVVYTNLMLTKVKQICHSHSGITNFSYQLCKNNIQEVDQQKLFLTGQSVSCIYIHLPIYVRNSSTYGSNSIDPNLGRWWEGDGFGLWTWHFWGGSILVYSCISQQKLELEYQNLVMICIKIGISC